MCCLTVAVRAIPDDHEGYVRERPRSDSYVRECVWRTSCASLLVCSRERPRPVTWAAEVWRWIVEVEQSSTVPGGDAVHKDSGEGRGRD